MKLKSWSDIGQKDRSALRASVVELVIAVAIGLIFLPTLSSLGAICGMVAIGLLIGLLPGWWAVVAAIVGLPCSFMLLPVRSPLSGVMWLAALFAGITAGAVGARLLVRGPVPKVSTVIKTRSKKRILQGISVDPVMAAADEGSVMAVFRCAEGTLRVLADERRRWVVFRDPKGKRQGQILVMDEPPEGLDGVVDLRLGKNSYPYPSEWVVTSSVAEHAIMDFTGRKAVRSGTSWADGNDLGECYPPEPLEVL